MDLNRVTIIGRLTRDPEIKTTTTGLSVANISLATNLVWTDQSGTKKEKSEFHNCVLWKRLAEIAGQYLTKGRRVYVEGRLETRDWTGQDGVKRYRTEIIVDNMIMLDGGNRAAGSSSSTYPSNSQNTEEYVPSAPPQQGTKEEEIKVEDIPF